MAKDCYFNKKGTIVKFRNVCMFLPKIVVYLHKGKNRQYLYSVL